MRRPAALLFAVAGGRLGEGAAGRRRRPRCRHPAAPHPGRHQRSAGPEREAGRPGCRAGPCRRELPSGRQSRRQGLGGVKSRPARTDSPGGAGSAGHPRTGARLPRQYVFPHPALRRSGPARRTVRCSAAGHRDSPAGPQLVVCALPGPLPVGLRRVCTARRKRPRLRGVPRAIPAGGVVGRSHRPPGGCSAGRGNALPRRRKG